MKQTSKNKHGFTLIEAVIFLFIFSLITLTFYELYAGGLNHIINSKNRLGAIAVANEKMEIARNLQYEDIGTIGGAVTGVLLENEDIIENSSQFHIHTIVEYVQDTLDGVYPDDTAWEDYKKLTITVSWTSGQEQMQATSLFVPEGLEVASPENGILVINVFSDQPGGTGIPHSNLHVTNSETGLDTYTQVDATGNITLMGDKITDSIENYQISVSKAGHETVNTLPPYPTTPYDPINIHASVIAGSINVKNIVQNESASLKISTVDYLDNPVPDIDFHIEGGKKMGIEVNDPIDLDPIYVYNLDSDASTNSSGEKDFGVVSPGLYETTLSPAETDYVLIDTDPISPASIFSAQNLTIKAKLADIHNMSLLVKALADAEDGSPLEGAHVQLSNTLGYNDTRDTSATGTAFFIENSDEFVPGDYDLNITCDGYAENTSQVTLEENQLKTGNIIMTSL